MKRLCGQTLWAVALLALASGAVLAQKSKSPTECRDSWWDGGRFQNHCEVREQTLPAGGAITVDAGRNGGIVVRGADRNDILVRARVQTAGPSQSEADALTKQIRIETAGLRIQAEGPEQSDDFHWSVSFDIFVPRRSSLSLESRNGGISITDVNGRIDFNCINGGVTLRRVGGSVHGSTTNGGLVVELSGDRWDGEELNVTTRNGGIIMSVPEGYSAHLETGTLNGNVSVEFPVTVQGRITKEISVNLGSGGATVRAMTTNGGVRLTRSSANE